MKPFVKDIVRQVESAIEQGRAADPKHIDMLTNWIRNQDEYIFDLTQNCKQYNNDLKRIGLTLGLHQDHLKSYDGTMYLGTIVLNKAREVMFPIEDDLK